MSGPADIACPWCEGAGLVRRRGKGTSGEYGDWELVCHRCGGTGRASFNEPMKAGPAVHQVAKRNEPDADNDPPDVAA